MVNAIGVFRDGDNSSAVVFSTKIIVGKNEQFVVVVPVCQFGKVIHSDFTYGPFLGNLSHHNPGKRLHIKASIFLDKRSVGIMV